MCLGSWQNYTSPSTWNKCHHTIQRSATKWQMKTENIWSDCRNIGLYSALHGIFSHFARQFVKRSLIRRQYQDGFVPFHFMHSRGESARKETKTAMSRKVPVPPLYAKTWPILQSYISTKWKKNISSHYLPNNRLLIPVSAFKKNTQANQSIERTHKQANHRVPQLVTSLPCPKRSPGRSSHSQPPPESNYPSLPNKGNYLLT